MSAPQWLLAEDDGEIDQEAVRLMVLQIRVPKHTPSERKAAVEQMLKKGLSYLEISRAVGTTCQAIVPLLDELGWELIPGGCSGGAKVAVPKDRPRKSAYSDVELRPLGQATFNPTSGHGVAR